MLKFRIWMVCAAALATLTPAAAIAGNYEDSFKVEKVFPVKPEPTLEVNNTYGDIFIHFHDKPEVRVEATARFKSGKPQKMEKLQEGLQFNMLSSPSRVMVETIIAPAWTKFVSRFGQKAGNFLNPGIEIQTRLVITVPTGTSLKVTNKFGNLQVTDEVAGAFDLDISHGDIYLGDLKADGKINLSYGTLLLDDAGNMEITGSFSRLRMDEVGDVQFNTKSCDVGVKEGGNIRITASRDEYELGGVASMLGEASFSEVEVDRIGKKASLNMKFSELSISGLSGDFEALAVDMKFSELEVNVPDPTDYSFSITSSGESENGFPDYMNNSRVEVEKNGFQVQTKGKRNKTIQIISEHSDINIKP